MFPKTLCCCLAVLLSVACGIAVAGVFDTEEVQVAPSPSEVRYLDFKESERIVDFDVSRIGPKTAALVQGPAGASRVVFWEIGSLRSHSEWAVPKEFTFRALAWHPLGRSFFLAGTHGSDHVIARVDDRGGSWAPQIIYRTRQEIRRLAAAPRPYVVDFESHPDSPSRAYRLFFGIKDRDGSYATRSITEDGSRDYQVIGRKKGITTFDEEGSPSLLEAPSALPLAFHPAGHILLWEDEKSCFHQAFYERDHWGRSAKLDVCGGTLTPTPNGLALMQWQRGVPGVTMVSRRGSKKDSQAASYTFLSTPSSVPDGKGIVGAIKRNDRSSLVFVPIRLPLAEVANAWMFVESEQDEELLDDRGGLLRAIPDTLEAGNKQMYSLYESEAYQCGQYDPSTPTRPYLVTTDIFWELLAAAYEGLFIVAERQEAIPAFWGFIDEAHNTFRQSIPDSPWAAVFSVLVHLGKDTGEKERGEGLPDDLRSELELIRAAEGLKPSPVLGRLVDYGELKPRGHYTSSPAMSRYFVAFKYLTGLAGELESPEGAPVEVPVPRRTPDPDELNKLGAEAKARARSWVEAYEVFIPHGRSPLAMRDEQLPIPPYAKHPRPLTRIFPLAWGFDNEVLVSTVYHQFWPKPEQITGPGGERLTPSGLDIASASGSGFATRLLSKDMEAYPPLRTVLEDLTARWRKNLGDAQARGNLYDRWMDALAVQWADGVAPPDPGRSRELWDAKRLQTGLASWATLRHATVLVNERTAAECGEGAFEPIVLTPPRGYVEPDPHTFHALAGLFRSMVHRVQSWKVHPEGTIPADKDGAREALKAGISRRLEQTAAKAELFEKMARKEMAGESLTGAEYEEILYVGRIAEHHFLIFKSLANEEFALSEPDPIPKIADVSGGGPFRLPYLMAAVGSPMEWNQIVPYFGRKEMVKGAVYSYYEFVSQVLMDDKDWIKALPTQPRPDWISPFISGSPASCPPQNPY